MIVKKVELKEDNMRFNTKKRLSLVLVFMLTVALFVPSFADGSASHHNYLPKQVERASRVTYLNLEMPGADSVEKKNITVGNPAHTVETFFGKFPKNSGVSMTSVPVKFNMLNTAYSADFICENSAHSIRGIKNGDTRTLDLSGAPGEIVVKYFWFFEKYRCYVSAAEVGDEINVKVRVDMENLIDWCNGDYTTTNSSFQGKIPDNNQTNLNAIVPKIKQAWGISANSPLPSADTAYFDVVIKTEVGKTVQEALQEAVIGNKALGSYFVGLGNNYVSEIKKYPRSNPNTISGIPHLIFSGNGVTIPNGGNDGTGWMYIVNGKVPNYGISQYYLTTFNSVQSPATDKGIQWRYTLDWGVDVGGPTW